MSPLQHAVKHAPAAAVSYPQPIVKWAGGKRWLAPTLVPELQAHLERTGGRYIEPFAGGAAIGIALTPAGVAQIWNDALEPVIHLYKTIRKMPGAVSWALRALVVAGTDEESYYRVRSSTPRSDAQRAAQFIYLNKVGFNGLYRENKSGEFNTPFGTPGKAKIPTQDELVELSELLANVQLTCGDFMDVIGQAQAGDVIYADPPYDGVEFTAYTAGAFGPGDQIRLAQALADAHDRGAIIYMTNADTERIHALYAWADEIRITSERRRINSDGEGRGAVSCVLVVGV